MRNVRRCFVLSVTLLVVAGCISPGTTSSLEFSEFGRAVKPSPRARAYSHYMSSVFLEQQGEFSKALEELEKIPDLDPEAVTPTLRLIRAHLRQRDYDRALEMAQKAVQQAPDRSNLWIVLGEIFHQLKRYDEATRAFTKAIELNPENIMGYGALVELQETTNDLVAAIDLYHRLIELNPDSAGLHYQLGINLIRISDSAGAKAELGRALELSSSLARAHYFLGVLALEAGDNVEAASRMRQYLASRPEDAEGKQMLAAALARSGDFQESSKLFQELLGGAELQPVDYLAAAYVALLAGEHEQAEKLLPPEGAPILSTYFQAQARQARGLPFQPLLESLDTIDGDINEETDANLSSLMYLFGRPATGEALLAKLGEFLALVPQSRSLMVMKARTSMALDRPEQAIEVLNKLLEVHPTFEKTHYYLAIAHDDLHHFEDTEKHIKLYLEKHPDDPEILNFLAYLYAENGVKLEEAEAMLQKALAAHPENPYYMDSLGWVYFKRGKADQAIELIQRAIYTMESDDAVLRDHLGDAYLLKGDGARAVAEWERALRLDPKIEGVKEKIDKQRSADGSSAPAS